MVVLCLLAGLRIRTCVLLWRSCRSATDSGIWTAGRGNHCIDSNCCDETFRGCSPECSYGLPPRLQQGRYRGFVRSLRPTLQSSPNHDDGHRRCHHRYTRHSHHCPNDRHCHRRHLKLHVPHPQLRRLQASQVARHSPTLFCSLG